MWEDLGEVRTLAVSDEWLGKGVGHGILDRVEADARAYGLTRLFCLTFETQFFGRHGYEAIAEDIVAPELHLAREDVEAGGCVDRVPEGERGHVLRAAQWQEREPERSDDPVAEVVEGEEEGLADGLTDGSDVAAMDGFVEEEEEGLVEGLVDGLVVKAMVGFEEEVAGV